MEENRKNFYDYLARVQDARDQMTLGWDSIKSDYEARPFRQRVKDRLHSFGINRPELNSIYSPNEQNVMAKSDAISNMFVRGMDLGMGGLQLSTMLLPSAGKLSTIAGVGSMAAALGGMGGLATGLGSLAMYSNPYTAAASIGLKGLSFGVQESILDPLANTRMFQSTANTSFRSIIGGLNSNTGRGGLSMSNSFQLGRGIESIRTNNRDLEPEKINQFLEAAANLPQMGFGVNADKAIENVSKFMDIMVKLSKQFKGKETELVQSMTQFSQMGMSLQEAERNIQSTSRMGTMLGIDSSKIMMAGGNVAQSMIGTNISQSTGYYMGSQAYIQADMMRQRGQLTPTQLLNFGGVQGISQIVASSQNTLLNSSLSNMFLKSVYTKQNGGVGAGVDFDLVDKLSKGQMSLEEIRNRAANITLSPEANMQFGFDKESVISALGDKAPDVANNMFDKLASRNPYGNTLQGRAKFAMQTMGLDMNSARLFAQYNMTYNPLMDDVMKSYKQDQYMAGMDPAYGGFQGFGIASQNIETAYKHVTRNVFGFLNSDTAEGVKFRRGLGSIITGGYGKNIMDFYESMSTDQNIKGFSPFDGVKDGKDLISKYNAGRNSNISDRDKSLETIGRRSLYSNINLYQGRDFDLADALQNKLTDKYNMTYGKNEITDPDKLNKLVEEETKSYLEGKSDKEYLITTSGQKLEGDEYRKAISGIIQGALTQNNNSISKNTPLIEEAKNKLVLSGKDMMGIKGMSTTIGSVLKGAAGESWKTIASGGLWNLYDGIRGVQTWGSSLKGLKANFMDANLEQDSFANKFNNRSVKDRFNMVQELLNNKDNDFGNYGMDQFGFSKISQDDKDSILNNDAVKEYVRIAKLPEAERKLEIEKMNDNQTQENVKDSISTIFGSSGYREQSSRYGGPNLIKGIVQEFLGKGTANKEDMKMTEEQLTKMKTELKGKTGIGEMIQYGKIVDDHLEIGDVSDKKRDRIAGGFLAKHSGLLAENNISSAKQVWDERKADKATTIQDFAVAVARGMQIHDTADSDNLQKWNDAKSAGSGK